jgi:aromatic-L-amino-acid decarboxylase
MIREDVAMARHLYELAAEHPELEAFTNNLSITTLRYVPLELRTSIGSEQTEAYLNRLNQLLLTCIENSGEAFCSNALMEGKFALRFCIVNFRTSIGDVEAVPHLLARLGRQAHAELRSQ